MAKKAKQADMGFTSGSYDVKGIPDYVVMELKYEAPLAYSPSGFGAPSAAEKEASKLNAVISRFVKGGLRSHFELDDSTVSGRTAPAASLPAAAPASAFTKRKGIGSEFIQSGFVQLTPKSVREADKLVKALKKDRSVWDAYLAPRPVPAVADGSSSASRNFEPSQGYLHSPSNGIGAMDVWDKPGAKGEGVTICDIEGAWNLSHEDLPSGIPLIGGTMINDLGWRNHGTAVLGEMVSQPNDFGTVGISHKSKAVVQSAVVGGVFNAAAAIRNATTKLKKGDVILIELHAPSPHTNRFIAMQFWSDIFTAIVSATKAGITVVEAAGNGNEDFDQPIYNGSNLQKDAGAIVVGAGIPPTNFFDHDGRPPQFPRYSRIGNPRSRIFFSNYGKIVNVQAWGWHVTTLGYGDAQGGPSEDNWYTLRFSGTSSASPIVTGAVAAVQGRAKKVKGAPLTPAQVRSLLMRTGRSQRSGPGVPRSQKIGPQPNLVRALSQIG